MSQNTFARRTSANILKRISVYLSGSIVLKIYNNIDILHSLIYYSWKFRNELVTNKRIKQESYIKNRIFVRRRKNYGNQRVCRTLLCRGCYGRKDPSTCGAGSHAGVRVHHLSTGALRGREASRRQPRRNIRNALPCYASRVSSGLDNN